jgi:hypothetical protein
VVAPNQPSGERALMHTPKLMPHAICASVATISLPQHAVIGRLLNDEGPAFS